MTAFVANVNPNEDSPEAKEQHEQGVVTFEVVSVHLYPYQDWCKEDVLEVAKVGGKSLVPWYDLGKVILSHFPQQLQVDSSAEVSGILELGNVWVFVQLIHRPIRTKNQVHKKPIA